MSEEINGWKPPIIYDYVNDKARIASQEDVDQLIEIRDLYFSVIRDARKAIELADQWKNRREQELAEQTARAVSKSIPHAERRDE